MSRAQPDSRPTRSLILLTSLLSAGILLGAPTNAQPGDLSNYPMRYMGDAAELTTAPNGAVIYKKALEDVASNVYTVPTVEKITDGVWVVGGYSIANIVVIEAPDGLIVYDTGDSREEGMHVRKAIQEKISKRPIRAIIYSHSHYVGGAGAMVDEPASIIVLGHPNLNETVETNSKGGGASSVIPELGPILTARAAVQFNNFMPVEGADASLAGKIKFGAEQAFLPVTRPVQDRETVKVAGLDLQFYTKYVSDDYSTTVWIPSKKVVLNNFFWPGTPNLYSLRGAVYRDPQVWRDGLREIRDLQPEYLLNTHARAISGPAKVSEAVTNYMDLITLTYDQTLRGILQGLGPDDLRYFVYQPKSLTQWSYNAQAYGESRWYPPAVFQYQMGWFDRDVTELSKLPPRETAARLVALMGGPEKVVAAAQGALDRKEYAWAAQLVDYVSRVDPTNAQARAIKANAFRTLGQLSSSSIGRSFYISEARALEGKETIPLLAPPSAEVIASDPATFVNYFRVRIDPRKAEPINKVITFRFGDKTVGLHVRNGIAEFLPEPAKYGRKADAALAMNPAAWAQLYLDPARLRSAVGAGDVTVLVGKIDDAYAILSLFDPLGPAPARVAGGR